MIMDQRGIGLSDRMTQMIDLETRVDDVRAVLDAAGSDRPVLYGQGLDGGAICAMFAATYPERTAGLLLWSGQATGIRDANYPWAETAEENEAFHRLIADTWGDEDLIGPLIVGRGRSLQSRQSGGAEGLGPFHALLSKPRRCAGARANVRGD